MTLERLILPIACWLCAVLFIGIAVYSFRTKKPMHFWTGAIVKRSEIRNIPVYNRKNALMWLIYGLWYVVIGILGMLGFETAAVLLLLAVIFLGLPILFLVYRRIYRTHKQ